MQRKNTVGDNIRKIRIWKGLTQEALALESGLSQGYINQLENGKRLYTQRSLEMIADALSTPIINFFQDEDIKTEDQEKQERDQTERKHCEKELLSLLNGMPDHIIEHYVTLVKLEKQLLKGKRG